MEVIHDEAGAQSFILGADKGKAPCFEGKDIYLRNATRTCIAPTGTIAILMNASSGIEPYFALENTRTMGDGTVLIEKPWPLNLGNKHIPKVANQISSYWHIQHQAAFQRHTDLAVSKTINLPETATPNHIYEAYVSMWEQGCKGGTLYRDGSRFNQVLKTVTQGSANIVLPPSDHTPMHSGPTSNGWRDAMPNERPGIIHKFEVDGLEGYIQVGLYDDGSPGEIFLNVARQGSTLDGVMDWLAQTTSVAFQIAHKHGIPFTVFTNKWIGRKFEPAGITRNADIPKVDSLADYLGRWLNLKFDSAHMPVKILDAPVVQEQRGATCPDCGAMLVFSEGCEHCNSCGYERC